MKSIQQTRIDELVVFYGVEKRGIIYATTTPESYDGAKIGINRTDEFSFFPSLIEMEQEMYKQQNKKYKELVFSKPKK